MLTIDDTCEGMRDLLRRRGLATAILHVRADGRVEVNVADHRGYSRGHMRADLAPESVDPLPSVAFAALGGTPC